MKQALLIGLLILISITAFGWWAVSTQAVPLVENRLSARLDRKVTIRDITFDLGRTTTIQLADTRIANPPWLAEKPFATFEKLSVSVNVIESVRRFRLMLPLVRVSNGRIDVRVNPAGESNYSGMFVPSGETSTTTISNISIDDLGFSVVDNNKYFALSGAVNAIPDPQAGQLPITAKGTGTYNKKPVAFDVSLGGLNELEKSDKGFPLRARFTSEETIISAAGTVREPFALAGFDLQVSAAGPTPAQLGPLLSLPLPALPPYKVEMRIYSEGDAFVVENLVGKVGDTDINGSARVSPASERMRLDAVLTSTLLDLDDLAGIIGAAPDSGPGETASAAQTSADQASENKTRVFPTKPFNFAALQRADMNVHYRASKISAPKIPLNDVDVKLKLSSGTLTLAPLHLGIGGGVIRLRLKLDPQGPIDLSGDFEKVSMQALLHDLDVTNEAAGVISGWLDLDSTGDDVAETLANLNGDIVALTQGGRLDSLLVEIMGLDVGQAIIAYLSDAPAFGILCGVIDFKAASGVLHAQKILIDTSDSTIKGSGQIDLGDETYALQLKTKGKDTSIFSGDAPIYINGTFKKPSAAPKIGETLLSLLTPIEFGEDSHVDCAAEMRSANNP